jgi:hypothetical protein
MNSPCLNLPFLAMQVLRDNHIHLNNNNIQLRGDSEHVLGKEINMTSNAMHMSSTLLVTTIQITVFGIFQANIIFTATGQRLRKGHI